jgi:hypothetical protein
VARYRRNASDAAHLTTAGRGHCGPSRAPKETTMGPAELETLLDMTAQTMRKELNGFEERLATAMQKALDVVVSELDTRIHQLEEDQARILRHLGLR